ncbi:NADH dehydrogenase [Liberibacter crescens]|nr:NADH dehydrogenase [Liberibacter crescens]
MLENIECLDRYIKDVSGIQLMSSCVNCGELTLEVSCEDFIALVKFLQNDKNCNFINIIDLCGVDWPGRAKRFDVVYHFLSPKSNFRVRVKLSVAEDEPVPSITTIYPGANWFEREVWDMYGVFFVGHPDLRRILTDYGFEGHPLRKDFPVSGFVEVHYDDESKRVVYEPIELQQEYRNFDFLSPWEGVEYVRPQDKKNS